MRTCIPLLCPVARRSASHASGISHGRASHASIPGIEVGETIAAMGCISAHRPSSAAAAWKEWIERLKAGAFSPAIPHWHGCHSMRLWRQITGLRVRAPSTLQPRSQLSGQSSRTGRRDMTASTFEVAGTARDEAVHRNDIRQGDLRAIGRASDGGCALRFRPCQQSLMRLPFSGATSTQPDLFLRPLRHNPRRRLATATGRAILEPPITSTT